MDTITKPKTFIIGSTPFFKYFPGYSSHDLDTLQIIDIFPEKLPGNVLHRKDGHNDIFLYRNMGKEGFIRDTLDSGVPMRAGKFLVPKFAKYLDLSISDLSLLSPCFKMIDEKHKYEEFIYSSYIKNGKFKLSPQELQEAYKIYCASRGLEYRPLGLWGEIKYKLETLW